jgi:hypothetical protein
LWVVKLELDGFVWLERSDEQVLIWVVECRDVAVAQSVWRRED